VGIHYFTFNTPLELPAIGPRRKGYPEAEKHGKNSQMVKNRFRTNSNSKKAENWEGALKDTFSIFPEFLKNRRSDLIYCPLLLPSKH